ncbi:N-acetylmuramoyl-L-alanine amidase [Thioalkalivibrio denitrificans]|uniref:1,6-anhydro-N-acetylmuramyl-L-alanine amidase AmpD n=1 Tax=Thioalkalivibrio denitrificans TaxID=108003 RepID=A0A1V3NDM7_9GAMM|nr:1,6-anhydro-N-acetylmuramyl-L-alanine amidase AmpD [Thioalkalivibrio denitrificans]OOG22896.1 N-acetylmuramoyl-L-alanine amidase [Thioalkalivibrio denitrificans]
MRVDVPSGWLEGARRVPSPNHDARPEGVRPELIVIHAISLPPGEFGGPWIDRLFTNRLDPQAHPFFREIAGLEVSAHLLIRRDGELVQYVPFHLRAWHAGVSSWRGREGCNDFSIGIELEGCDDRPFEDVQYERLAGAILALRRAYPSIAPDSLTGHADIAPERKTDPGPHFRWATLWAALGTTGLT